MGFCLLDDFTDSEQVELQKRNQTLSMLQLKS